jgi:predicted DNA-binding WGR domain protein
MTVHPLSSDFQASPRPIADLVRVDPARAMARYWRLSIEPTLFGEIALVRSWGRIGGGGRSRTEIVADPAAAERLGARLATAKHRRGYRPRG